jgi:glucose/arabinose dehydrogenase
MTRRAVFAAVVLSFCLAAAVAAGPADLPTGFTDELIAGSLSEPVSLALIPDPPDVIPRVLFVEQRTARIRLIVGYDLFTVGTVPGVNSAADERGLLGIAVDPAWPVRPYVYIHATDNRSGTDVVISRFTLTGDLPGRVNGELTLDVASRRDLLNNLPDNADNHNGGTVRFGTDNRLYVSLGDDAVSCNAQDVGIPAGKILRLDTSRLPAGAGGPGPYAILIPPGNPFPAHPDSEARLVWTLGLRNPFRFHVDRQNGELFVADVGQNSWEEYTRFSAGGQNGGWPWREGPNAFITCSGTAPASIAPIAFYDHDDGIAVMSVGVYRRPATGSRRFPAEYDGNAFYSDYYTGFIRRLVGSGSSWSPAPVVPGQPNSTDWATGFENVPDVLHMPDGSLWYCRQFTSTGPGEIRRISFPGTVDAETPVAAAAALTFAVPHPTPSRGRVTLSWTQPEEGAVRLVVYDAGGRVRRVLSDGDLHGAGPHSLEWDGLDRGGSPAPAGLYFAQVTVGEQTKRTRITLLR